MSKTGFNKGITLIVLVITIIVLLILAGVSIAMLSGEGGILAKAENAKKQTEIANIIEKAKFDILEVQVDNDGKITGDAVNEIIAKYDKENRIRTDKEEKYIITEKDYEIKVVDIWNETNSIGENDSNKDSEEGIQDGYIKPSGTMEIATNGEYNVTEYEKVNVNVPTYEKDSKLKIIEKQPQIDVSNYQYVDTTGLYTESEIQSGEGKYWASGTASSKADTIISVNVGFVPTKIVFTKKGTAATLIYNSSVNPTKVYTWSRAGFTETELNSSVTNAANIRTIGSTTTFYTVDDSDWEWFAVK